MSLKGSLQTVALPEVLHLLSGTGKTGELHISGDGGEGWLWFADGRLTAFTAGRADEPFDAVFELLRLADGDFTFAAGEDPADGSVRVEGGVEVAPTLAAAQERLVEWQEITAVVPGLEHHLTLRREAPADAITLDRSQWELIAAVGDGRSVRCVLETSGLSEFEGCRAVRGAVDAGLLDVAEPQSAPSPAVPAVVIEDASMPEPVVAEALPVVDEAAIAGPGHDLGFGPEAWTGASGEWDTLDEDEPALPASALRFGVEAETAGGPPEPMPTYAADDPGDFGPTTAQEDELQPVEVEESAGQAADRYAALRAAMLEVHQSDDGAAHPSEEDPLDDGYPQLRPAAVFEVDSEPDGRAALEALLDEVRCEEEASYLSPERAAADPQAAAAVHEMIDGLADRGPWTDGELASMDGQRWSQEGQEDDGVGVLAYGSPAPGAEDGPAPADLVDDPAAAEAAEPPVTAEEPMNRGLLLKFLSSVRN